MKLALNSDRIHRLGAEVIALSVDSEERQAAMLRRWPALHVKFVSDPGGEHLLQPIDMFDPEERGGIALPGLFVLDPDGREVFAYRGRDFADRTHDDDLFGPLEALGLDPLDPPPGEPVDATVDVDQRGAFTPPMFGPYFRGNRSAALAIGWRSADDTAKAVAREHRTMSDAMLEAWRELRSS